MSYVTGRHSFKVGYQGTLMTDDRTWYSNNNDLWYRFNNGIPNQLTQTISPWINDARAGWDAVYGQEQFTMGRLTLQGALRFDVARSWFPEQNIGPDRFLPVAFNFPETKGVDSYKDITPRMGAAIDVFGNGKTAREGEPGEVPRRRGRVHHLRELEPDAAGTDDHWSLWRGGCLEDVDRCGRGSGRRLRLHQSSRARQSCGSQRRWRGGFLRAVVEYAIRPAGPDRQLRSRPPQRLGREAVGLELRRFRSAAAHGAHVDRSRLLPALVRRVHPQRQSCVARPRTSRLTASSRRSIRGCRTAVGTRSPASTTLFPSKSGQVDNLATLGSKYGEWYQYFNGFDITLNLRTQGGLTLQGERARVRTWPTTATSGPTCPNSTPESEQGSSARPSA